MKKAIIAIVVLILIIGGYFFMNRSEKVVENEPTPVVSVGTDNPETGKGEPKSLGKSVEGRDIFSYQYGTGDTKILFVGGIHGGYEWNTSLVAYELMDYLKANPTVIPSNVQVNVIPVLNPDGLNKVVGTTTKFSKSDVSTSQATVVAGRFNGNDVDLNRNFDCDWQPEGKWQNKTVDAGESVFSEPESLAIKNYVEANKPTAVVVWYSSAGGVFASSCHNGVSAETNTLTDTFAEASGYPAHQDFDFYEITGDMVNWLAKNNIPAVSVLLTNHTDIEWTKNKAGVDAVLKYYAK